MCLKVVFRAWDSDTRRSTLLPDSVSQDGFAICMTDRLRWRPKESQRHLIRLCRFLDRTGIFFIEDMDVKNIPLEDDRGFHVRSGW